MLHAWNEIASYVVMATHSKGVAYPHFTDDKTLELRAAGFIHSAPGSQNQNWNSASRILKLFLLLCC